MNVGLINLGCDKNRVDAEKMIEKLFEVGYTIVDDKEKADIILVNTCAFIEDAKRETIEKILDVIEYKKTHNIKIVVTGCFATRYKKVIEQEFPEVDVILPYKEENNIVKEVNALLGQKGQLEETARRYQTTPPWYAYLKISDGCDNRCSYCIIPYLRGKYQSNSVESIMKEATILRKNGVKELIVVAQDTTNYGIDNYHKHMLVPLLKMLCSLGFWKVRLLYAYPELVTDELLDFIDNEPRMAKYIDIPMQHIQDSILKRMNRKSDEKGIRDLMRRIRQRKNYIAVRSTFITGFPGETEEDNLALCEFVKENIDFAGFFTFSSEEGTVADKMKGKVKKSDAKRRRNEAEKAWQIGFEQKQQQLVGKEIEVICDGIDAEKGKFVGRSEYQTPEVDTVVYFSADFNVVVGEIYNVKITESNFNLFGVAVRK